MAADQPEYRISDAEREDALEVLGEHMRSGRLDIGEFDQRTARITTARTRGELAALFADLPEPRPAVLRANLPTTRPTNSVPSRRPPPGRLAVVLPMAVIPIVLLLLITPMRGMGMMMLLPIVAVVAGVALLLRGRYGAGD